MTIKDIKLNTGNWNTGNWNTGDSNTGDNNTGDNNTGYSNTGNSNNGNSNTGNWNTGNRNTGYFNIDNPKVRIFWKETDTKRGDIIFPDFLYFNLTEWIDEKDMTDEQKINNTDYKTTWWILVKYDYKEAFQRSYNNLSKEKKERQTKQLKDLPNWDPDIFFIISGIRIDDDILQDDEIILNWIKYKKVD